MINRIDASSLSAEVAKAVGSVPVEVSEFTSADNLQGAVKVRVDALSAPGTAIDGAAGFLTQEEYEGYIFQEFISEDSPFIGTRDFFDGAWSTWTIMGGGSAPESPDVYIWVL